MNYNLRDMLFHLKSKDYIKYNGIDVYNEKEKYLKENIYEAIKDNVRYFAFHPKIHTNMGVFFQISISSFKLLKLNLNDLIEIQERFNSSAIGLYGKRYDNSACVMLSDSYGRLFRAYISKDKSGYSLRVYDTAGSINLINIHTKNNELTNEEIKQLESAWSLLMKYYEDQKKSKERYEEIKKYREYIKVERTGTGYASAYYEVKINKNIPIELSDDEIAKYCDNWNYCFGGKCTLVKEDKDSRVYNVVVYTD